VEQAMQSELNPALIAPLRGVGVVPVLTVEEPRRAADLARALVAGGLDILEVTLRTTAALEAMQAMIEAVPMARIGAGTVRSPEQGEQAIRAGARFLVSPGMSPALAEAAEQWGVPWLPGVTTPSEAMALADLGYRLLKFFPAEASGGTAWLRALRAPLAGIQFCPTGGIGPDNAAAYLAETNVACVGGSWIVPAEAVGAGNWAHITGLARAARALRG
jgi:2-dehydro-3-deoxyphosphogluconate aldolase/(4S)-4-hydroxy-2-oxoglutarate aldolase